MDDKIPELIERKNNLNLEYNEYRKKTINNLLITSAFVAESIAQASIAFKGNYPVVRGILSGACLVTAIIAAKQTYNCNKTKNKINNRLINCKKEIENNFSLKKKI